jgi:hypothetical protein
VAAQSTSASQHVYLPFISLGKDREIEPFGVEIYRPITSGKLLDMAVYLNIDWIRLNQRISWRDLQPNEGDPIRWELMEAFEAELRALKSAEIMPVVIINDFPRWATIHPSSCSAIRPDKFPAFAAFLEQLVQRYSNEEYNVYHWEMGNEPDVDIDLVPSDHLFGCWGDVDDPYYGGRHYGEMLQAVVPAMRRASPDVRIWLGGLLLDNPATTMPGRGRPELFLQGVLEAEAAPYFDIVAYHWYPQYWRNFGYKLDFDTQYRHSWYHLGGGVTGKAEFLRQMMAEYGVEKPLVLNETAFNCPRGDWCENPDDRFFDLQADMLVRMQVRTWANDVQGMSWYTLHGPGWHWGGLLQHQDVDNRPAFGAYQTLIQQLADATYAGPVDYAPEIEAYSFVRGDMEIHVLWSIDDSVTPVMVPANRFVVAINRDGNLLIPQIIGDSKRLLVPFEPVYIWQRR